MHSVCQLHHERHRRNPLTLALSAKGGGAFPEHFLPKSWRISARSAPSKSDHETSCLIEQGWGVCFGKSGTFSPKGGMCWSALPRRVIFDLEDGLGGCLRSMQKNPVPRFGTGLHNADGRLFASRILFTRCQPGRTWHLSYSCQSCASCLHGGFGCSG